MDFNTDGSSELSFVWRIDGKIDFWHIAPSGDYAVDCQSGRSAALELNRYMTLRNLPNLLSSVARAMMGHGRYVGLEVGFFQQVSEDLTASPSLG